MSNWVKIALTIIILLILAKNPQLITEIINAITIFINGVSNGMSNVGG